MAQELSGAGSWHSFQKQTIGVPQRFTFIGLEKDVPPTNPAMKAQDVITIDIDGDIKKAGLPTALKNVFRNNKLTEGDVLEVTYEGTKKGKSPLPFHSFKAVLVEKATDFPAEASNEPQAGAQPQSAKVDPEVKALEARLARARSKKGAA